MPTPASIDTRGAAVRDYVAGESSVTVGKRYRVSPESVVKWVREAGHQVRTRGGKPQDTDPIGYRGGWVTRGLIRVPLAPVRRSA